MLRRVRWWVISLSVAAAVCELLGLLRLARYIEPDWRALGARLVSWRSRLTGRRREHVATLGDAIGVDDAATPRVIQPSETVPELARRVFDEIDAVRAHADEGAAKPNERIDRLEASLTGRIRAETRDPIGGLAMIAAGIILGLAASIVAVVYARSGWSSERGTSGLPGTACLRDPQRLRPPHSRDCRGRSDPAVPRMADLHRSRRLGPS
jgi:hypothetical protein